MMIALFCWPSSELSIPVISVLPEVTALMIVLTSKPADEVPLSGEYTSPAVMLTSRTIPFVSAVQPFLIESTAAWVSSSDFFAASAMAL